MRSTCTVKKRGKRSQSQRCRRKREKALRACESDDYVAEDTHLEYFENLTDEVLPELEIEQANCIQDAPIVPGYRIVDIPFFIEETRKLHDHNTKCTMGKMKFKQERKQGLVSIFYYYCGTCEKTLSLSTHPANNTLNQTFVWGATSIGIGYGQADELLSVMNIPCVTPKYYRKLDTEIGVIWETKLQLEMAEAAKEERRMAIERGDVEHGVPFITVIVDGGWAKRSYGHGFSSLSGVGCIIGEKTKKLVYLGIKNKFCLICAVAASKNENPSAHKCFKNFSGASSSMEQDIIVQGFNESEVMYDLRYKYVVGDGDSSVYARILQNVTYGRYVMKLECANHITRAFTSNIHKLAVNTKFEISARRILKCRLPRLSAAVRKSIAKADDTRQLCEDLRNIPYHVFGNHINCRDEYCTRKTNNEENYIPLLQTSALFEEITKVIDNVVRKANRLSRNVTTNYAERYMSLVAKFSGGKRINYVLRGSYQRRCYGAALSFNSGPSWHLKGFTSLDQTHRLNIFARKRKYLNEYKHAHPKKKKKFGEDTNAGIHMDYGPNAAEEDLPEDEMKVKKEELLSRLKSDNADSIATETVGQHDNVIWHEVRRNRITASSFGRICNRRDTTSCHSQLKNLLYNSPYLTTDALVYGRTHENVAVQKYEEIKKIKVVSSGFFISKEYPYLGASPDGLVNDDGLVEVKCLYSIRKHKVKESLENKQKSLCVQLQEGRLLLKKNHQYFYQIQGQLNIVGRTYCDLVLYTDVDLEVIRIVKDEEFWSNIMLPRLNEFFFNCMLPELVDPRIPRGLQARDSELIINAQGKRKPAKKK